MSIITSIPRPDGASERSLPRKPPPTPNSIAVAVTLLLLLCAAVWSTVELRINLATMMDSISNATNFLARMFPLDFPPAGELAALIFETLAIVVLATVLAVLISVPVALFAAWNTTSGKYSRTGARVIIVLARAVPDLILAIIFLRIFGLGALPGILAMGLHSVGMIGKLYADAVEELDNGPQEAIRAAGGGRVQQIVSGILIPLMPQIIATALHRFDINLRISVILGYVGIGGIGLAIATALRSLNYQRGMALALVVLLLCIAVELISGAIRAALLGGDRSRSRNRTVSWADRVSENWVSRGQKKTGTSEGLDAGARPIAPPWNADRVRRFLSMSAVLAIVFLSLIGAEFSWEALGYGLANAPTTLGAFFPPAGGDLLPVLLSEMLVTVQIALAATLLGSILAVPIGIFAARNVVTNRAVQTFFRVLIVFIRGLPELIVAIIFVVITGLGGVAGALALAIGAVGLLSKLVADSLEETDVRVQQAVQAHGASRTQVFFAATVRQSAPAFVAHIMYLLDSNIRAATLLGIVGAGGIGFLLLNASRVMQFDVVTTIVMLVLVVVLTVEAISLWIRKAVH
ncbi:phosphonate transport system permease protein [Arthrobacter subterraneus]|uniref:Phosphonate transport system permease protein n=1 Tax=Arthrobacter subterraneus TaxID=335973 RepID=A0A1G8IQQ9_9MICC|nr:phosphonate ABC transporter, permease protein PhnE [Arthrobacter subterraneus]SDI20830.1 phosphonate transport system permease protein [Arthrobacter subterraneus]